MMSIKTSKLKPFNWYSHVALCAIASSNGGPSESSAQLFYGKLRVQHPGPTRLIHHQLPNLCRTSLSLICLLSAEIRWKLAFCPLHWLSASSFYPFQFNPFAIYFHQSNHTSLIHYFCNLYNLQTAASVSACKLISILIAADLNYYYYYFLFFLVLLCADIIYSSWYRIFVNSSTFIYALPFDDNLVLISISIALMSTSWP